MKIFHLTFFLALILSSFSHAAVEVRKRDLKLPTQQMVEKQTITSPIIAATNYILTTNAGPISAAAVTVSSFTHQPDVPRQISITPTGTTGDVEACTVVVTGTNIFGTTITDSLAFLANASTATNSLKAFKTVSSVTWPADCESGGFNASWIIGVTDNLGMSRCLPNAGSLVFTTFNAAYETTRATVTAHVSDVSKNLIDINGTLDGTKSVEAYFFQNYRCQP